MKKDKKWEVIYMPSEDGKETRYFKRKKDAVAYWRKKTKKCNICGVGKICAALEAEWQYFKIDKK